MAKTQKKTLVTIFEEALSQPRHIAVTRLKIAYFLYMTDASYQSLVDDAFEENEDGLTKSGVYFFVTDGKAITTDRAYWLFKKLEEHVSNELKQKHKKDIFSLAAKASLRRHTHLSNTDADKILDELQAFAFPNYIRKTPDIVPLPRYLSDLGFNDNTVSFLDTDDNRPDIIDILCENDSTATQLRAIKSFITQKLISVSADIGITPDDSL